MFTCNKVKMGRAVNCTTHETARVQTSTGRTPLNNTTEPVFNVSSNNNNNTSTFNFDILFPFNFEVGCDVESGLLTKFVFKKQRIDAQTLSCWYDYTCCNIQYF